MLVGPLEPGKVKTGSLTKRCLFKVESLKTTELKLNNDCIKIINN